MAEKRNRDSSYWQVQALGLGGFKGIIITTIML